MGFATSVMDHLRRTRAFAGVHACSQRLRYLRWIAGGGSGPPPHLVKKRAVLELAARFGTPVLIETGTHLGEMVQAARGAFDEIYSIELSPELHRRATRRFARDPRVTLLRGDSGEVLARVLERVDRPALLWLDAHWSAGATARGAVETPIEKELRAVAAHPRSCPVVLIDDARCFGTGDYPTLEAVERWAREHGYARCEVRDDIIRMVAAAR
jgi:hypothetical protein